MPLCQFALLINNCDKSHHVKLVKLWEFGGERGGYGRMILSVCMLGNGLIYARDS